ncbi:ABC transporter substrate-binding protein [Halarcobacter anaerophilus]|uniref:ABC transporter substrate-binding protein n=1 Tax=Halarcobacter anaerophilus TaxID=877500 RepID=UPI00069696E4|nr:ABC transporter substrate-binding protein [Halarcobacter anaerophilus]
MVYVFRSLLFFLFTTILYASSNKENVSVQLNWKYQFEFAGFIAAKEKGFYDNAGLNVEIREFNPQINILKDLKEEKSTFSVYDFSVLSLEKQKDSIMLIANYFKRSALVFVTRQDIITPFDLKNRVVMMEGEQVELSTLNALLRKFNISKKDFTFKQHTFNPQDFIDGKVDAMSAYFSNEIYELKKSHTPFNIIDPQAYGIYGSGVNVFTTKKLIQSNPELVKKFITATNKGWEYALKNKDELVNIIYEKYSKQKTKEALLYEAKQIEKLMMPSIYDIGEIDKQLLQRSVNEFVSEGLLEKRFSINDIVFDLYKGKDTQLTFTKNKESILKTKMKLLCVLILTGCLMRSWKRANL